MRRRLAGRGLASMSPYGPDTAGPMLIRSWEGEECAECGDILVANEEGQPTCTCCGRPGPRKGDA